MHTKQVSVILSVMRHHCVNTAEQLEVLLVMETVGDSRNIVLDESPDFPHGFDAAFAKLLWHLFFLQHCIVTVCLLHCRKVVGLWNIQCTQYSCWESV